MFVKVSENKNLTPLNINLNVQISIKPEYVEFFASEYIREKVSGMVQETLDKEYGTK